MWVLKSTGNYTYYKFYFRRDQLNVCYSQIHSVLDRHWYLVLLNKSFLCLYSFMKKYFCPARDLTEAPLSIDLFLPMASPKLWIHHNPPHSERSFCTLLITCSAVTTECVNLNLPVTLSVLSASFWSTRVLFCKRNWSHTLIFSKYNIIDTTIKIAWGRRNFSFMNKSSIFVPQETFQWAVSVFWTIYLISVFTSFNFLSVIFNLP